MLSWIRIAAVTLAFAFAGSALPQNARAQEERMTARAKPATPRPTGGAAAAKKAAPVKWHTTWNFASAEARKTDRLIMMYFSGSDWDDWSKKLWKEVLSTPMFLEWAQKNVVLFQCDFPSEELSRKLGSTTRMQNDRFKQKYSVDRVPTIIFMDADGEPYVRCVYEQAALRPNEKKGAPLKWIEFADGVVKARPGTEKLAVQPSFTEGSEYARKRGLPFLLLITREKDQRYQQMKKDLMNNQKFIRYVNRTMTFMPWDWPDDTDTSANAKNFRAFVEKHKIGTAASQLVMFFPLQNKVKLKITQWSPTKVEAIRKQLERELPKFDYGGQWLTDFHIAQAVASQMKRELLVAFTSMDSSDWCQKMEAEIFKNPEFREYSARHLVLCRVDFPKTKELSKEMKEQNERLADVYHVQGYPTVVVLNDGGQKIGTAKYQKGGPRPFLKEIDELRRKDFERRTLMSDQVEVSDR